MLHIYHFTLHKVKSWASWVSRWWWQNEHWCKQLKKQKQCVFLVIFLNMPNTVVYCRCPPASNGTVVCPSKSCCPGFKQPFSLNRPLGRFSLQVAMSVCLLVCLSVCLSINQSITKVEKLGNSLFGRNRQFFFFFCCCKYAGSLRRGKQAYCVYFGSEQGESLWSQTMTCQG